MARSWLYSSIALAKLAVNYGYSVNKVLLFVINDVHNRDGRTFNAMRLALNLVRRSSVQVRVFQAADGVFWARKEQKTPDGYYNIERMLKPLTHQGEVAT